MIPDQNWFVSLFLMLEDIHQLSLRVEFITMQKEGRASDRLHYKLHGRMAALAKPSVPSMPEENLTG